MKLSCDIIQDLIPSYADEICSEATRMCVEEHLETCESCQKIMQLCKDNIFSAKDLEQKELDALKKVKSKLKRQHLFSYLLLLFMTFFGLYTFSNSAKPSTIVYHVLLIMCLAGTYLFTVHGNYQKSSRGRNLIPVGLSVLLSVFSFLLMYFCLRMALSKELPFGLEPYELGPFISNLLLTCFFIQLALSGWLLLYMFRQNMDCRWKLCLFQAGAFLSLCYRTLLNHMSPFEDLQMHLLKNTIVILSFGIVGAIFCLYSSQKTSRSLP